MAGETITTPGEVIGGGLHETVFNIRELVGADIKNVRSISNAMENTGLWLRVKDIELPKWFIKFKCETARDKNTEIELTRWMEILQQNINEK